MGLRCIIGHDYGDPRTTEERQERGNERVVTITEYRECARCNHRKVLSENTEVRPIDPEQADPDQDGETAVDVPAAGSSPATSGTDAETDQFEDADAEDDDGVILEDGESEPERARGEWPESETEGDEPEESEEAEEWPDDHEEAVRPDEETEIDDWPDQTGEDEGFAAEPSSGGPGEDVDFGGGLTPESTAEAAETESGTIEGGASSEDGGQQPADSGSGIRRASAGPTPTSQQRSADPDAVVTCPECGYRNPSASSSLRPGDICPECQMGYLTEQSE